MIKSDSITKIAPALTEAQKFIGAATKEAANDFYSSKYADLGSIMAVCKEPLLAQGISILQPVDHDEHGNHILETILLHTSGEFLGSRTKMEIVPLPRKKDGTEPAGWNAPISPQAVGSAISYYRRYALQAMVFIPAVDDDAEWAERALAARPPETAEEQAAALAKKNAEILEHEKARMIAQGLDPKLAEPANETPSAPTAAEPKDVDWKDIECHIGKATGPILGKKISSIIKMDSSADHVEKISAWFESQIGSSKDAKDSALMTGIRQAVAAWKAHQQNPTPPEKQEAPKETPPPATKPAATPSAPKTTASPTDWREYEIPGKSPTYSGHKLGTFSTDEIVTLNTEFLEKIDWSRATLQQKKLRSMVALALAELLPPAAKTDEPEHTAQLRAKLVESEIEPAVFLRECLTAGWIANGESLEDVTPKEAEELLGDWQSVVTQCDEVPM